MSHVNRNSSPWLLEKFRKVTAFSKAADVLNSQISQAGKITTNTEKIVRVIMLAIYRGGLAKPAYLSQLINIILKGELEINVSPIGPYLEFSPSDYAGSGNDGFRRWFIDTETLAAIHALNAAKDKRKLSKVNDKSLFQLVSNHCASVVEFNHISSLKVLCEAGALYAAEHPEINLPAYLVNYATGKTSTTSISPSCWQTFWQTEPAHHSKGEEFSVETDTPSASLQKRPTSRFTDKVFLSKLRHAIKSKDSNGSVIPITETLQKLDSLKNMSASLPQTMLLGFFSHGIKEQSWKRSTANTYLSHLGTHWLLFTKDVDIISLDEYGMTELFEALLAVSENNISHADKASALKQFFIFNNEVFNTTLPVFDDVFIAKVSNIRNYVIRESNFIRFINNISEVDEHQNLKGQGLVLTAILMARCGLRPSEALKLRLKDVEPSAQHCIFVRQNRFGTNKSYSARRKIPLSLMLKPEEFCLFKSYLKRRLLDANNQLGLLLFSSSGDANLPYSLSDFHNKFSERLSRVCGEHVHTYHLRHKAISTLQAVLSSDVLLTLCPYNEKQVAQIRRFFAVDNSRDTLYEIAAFAGHLSPKTTFRNYLHFTDIVLYERLSANPCQRNRRYWENLSALSKHLITRRCASDVPEQYEIQTLLTEALCGKQTSKPQSIEENKPELIHPERKTTYADCLTALERLEKGETIPQVADMLNQEDSIINDWYERAVAASELRTTKGKPRLFPAKCRNDSIQLLPVKPASNAERQRAELAIESARKLFQSDRSELIWFIQRVINTAMNSQSYLKFDDADELYRFIRFALRFSKVSEWQLELDMPKHERSQVKAQWQKIDADLSIKISTNEVLSEKFKNGRARLYFLHPQKPRSDAERYSSNAIKYVSHVLAIMLPGVLATNTEMKYIS